jgi:hypothetical protein
MRKDQSAVRVLGIAHYGGGFGFAVLEGPATPVEWGVKRLGKEQEHLLRALRDLCDRFAPDVVAVERPQGQSFRRGAGVRKRIEATIRSARGRGIAVIRVSRSQLQQHFAPYGSVTKYEIAEVIAREIPALAHKLPPRRKAWMTEDHRMRIFDATSLALAVYWHEDIMGEG